MTRIAIGSDHAGYDLKQHLVEMLVGQGHDVDDQGTNSTESVDYPAICAGVGRTVRDGDADFGSHAMQGRQYTWSGSETLVQLVARRDEILERHETSLQREKKERPDRPLIEVLAGALDDEAAKIHLGALGTGWRQSA